MRKRRATVLRGLLHLVDIPVILLALTAAHWLRFSSGVFPVQYGSPPLAVYQRTFYGVACLWFLMFWMIGLYRKRERFGVSYVFRLIRVVILATGFLLAMVFFYRDFSYSRLTVGIAVLTTLAFILVWHGLKFRLFFWLRERGYDRRRALVVGTGRVGLDMHRHLKADPMLEYEVVGLCGDPHFAVDPKDFLGSIEAVPGVVRDRCVDDVFLAIPAAAHQQVIELVRQCERAGAVCTVVPDVFSIMMTVLRLDEVAGHPAIRLEKLPIHTVWGKALKRALDIVGALVGLLLFAPVSLWCILRLRGESPGPILYRQTRVGLDNRPFTILKFRSMRVDAEKETGPVWASVGDPRRTNFGAFMRKYSLDEIPQFWNVLKGEMSLVGPRPERPFFVTRFKEDVPHYLERHRVKAGLTGWAQVNGLRGQSPIELRTQYDIWYIENWSVWLDLEIVFKTVGVAFANPTGN